VESIYYVIGITVPNISTKGNNSEEKTKRKAFIMSSALQFLMNCNADDIINAFHFFFKELLPFVEILGTVMPMT
jgi:hypothetical protein